MVKRSALLLFLFIAICIMWFSGRIFETNETGYVQVKQAFWTGEMSVRTEPGTYGQNGGTITTYKVSDVFDFNKEPILVQFGDASTAEIGGQFQYKLPLKPDALLAINTEFRSDSNLYERAIKQVVRTALMQSATYFRAEEVYSTRKSEFTALVRDQIRDGIYATNFSEELIKDDISGESKTFRRVAARLDGSGKPIVNETGVLRRYDIEVVQFLINQIDFDEKTDSLITRRKDAEQMIVLNRAQAEGAKQAALTAVEEGKRDVAQAEAAALVKAKTAIVDAERETKVQEQVAMQAEQKKRATIADGEAQAQAAKLKVAAGLTPQEQAEFEMKTRIGVAQALASVKLPGVMVLGGEKGGAADPWQAVGLESMMRISKNMAQKGGE